MKKNRLIAMGMAVVMAAGAMTGCGSGGADKDKSADGKSPQEVIMWGSMSGDAAEDVKDLVEKYNDSQEKYQVTYTVQDSMEEKLLTALAGGEVPDIVMWDRFTTATYAAKGAFLPIDDYVKDDNMDLGQFYEPAVEEMKGEDGKLYGIPATVDTRIMFYNKELLAEADVDPASIKTWEDLKKAASAATKRDESGKLLQAGFVLSDPGLYNVWILQAGGQMIDTAKNPAVTDFNSEAGKAVLDYWDELLNKEKVYEIGFEDGFGGNSFKAGKAAMCMNGPWALAELEESGIDYGVIELPAGPGGDKAAVMGGLGFVIPSKAKKADAAWDFIKWWTTEKENGVEFAKTSGYLPANKEAAADDYFMNDEILSVFSETMLYATTRPKVPGYSDVEGLALRPQLELYTAGDISADEALAAAQKQGDEILKEAAAK